MPITREELSPGRPTGAGVERKPIYPPEQLLEEIAEWLSSIPVSRRTFLRISSVITAGILGWGALETSSIASTQYGEMIISALEAEKLAGGETLMLHQCRVRSLGGRHVVQKGETYWDIVRKYYGTAILERCLKQGEISLRTLMSALREITGLVIGANQEYKTFDPINLRSGEIVWLPSERLLEAGHISVGTNDIYLAHFTCDQECPEAPVAWVYNWRPGVVGVHGYTLEGERLKSETDTPVGMRGTVFADFPVNNRKILKFQIKKRTVRPATDYDFNGPQTNKIALNLGQFEIFSCLDKAGKQVVALTADLFLPQ